MQIRWNLVMPLASYVVPTVIIGYGYIIPKSCIAGVNDLTIGFATSIAAACVTYVMGVRTALRIARDGRAQGRA